MLEGFTMSPIAAIGPTWSLSIEWWLYLIAPYIQRAKLLIIALAVASYYLFLVASTELGSHFATYGHGLSFMSLAWMWLAGFAYYHMRGKSAGFVLLMFPFSVAVYEGCTSVGLPVFIAIAVIVISSEVRLNDLARKALGWLGDVSFPLYLTHSIVLDYLHGAGCHNSIVMALCALAVAATCLHTVDIPSRRIRIRIFQHRSTRHIPPTSPQPIRQTCSTPVYG